MWIALSIITFVALVILVGFKFVQIQNLITELKAVKRQDVLPTSHLENDMWRKILQILLIMISGLALISLFSILDQSTRY